MGQQQVAMPKVAAAPPSLWGLPLGARLAFAKGLCTPSPTDASNYCKQTYLVVDISLYLVGYLRAVHTRIGLCKMHAYCMHVGVRIMATQLYLVLRRNIGTRLQQQHKRYE